MTTSYATQWLPPVEGKVSCSIGASLSRHLDARQGKPAPKRKAGIPDRDFYAFRYNSKPPSVDDSREGVFHRNKVGENTTIQVELPSSKNADTHHFSGGETSAKDVECILIYDEDTGTLVLEKLDAFMNLQLDRKPLARAGATTSEPRPVKPLPASLSNKSRSSTVKRYEEEEEGEMEEDDVPLKITSKPAKKSKVPAPTPTPKSLPPKPTPKPTPIPVKPSTTTKKSVKKSSAAVEPVHALPPAPKPTKRQKFTPPPVPPTIAPAPEPRAALALPGGSSTNIYAAPLTAAGLPSTIPNVPQAEEEEDDDDDWDEVSPPQPDPDISMSAPAAAEPSGISGSTRWVMEEDLGDDDISPVPNSGGMDDDEFDEALFGAELEQSLMEDADADADGDDDDFLMAAVSPVVESTSFLDPQLSHMGGSDDDDTDTSTDESDDD